MYIATAPCLAQKYKASHDASWQIETKTWADCSSLIKFNNPCFEDVLDPSIKLSTVKFVLHFPEHLTPVLIAPPSVNFENYQEYRSCSTKFVSDNYKHYI